MTGVRRSLRRGGLVALTLAAAVLLAGGFVAAGRGTAPDVPTGAVVHGASSSTCWRSAARSGR
jgi:hypothetical protein